MKSKQFLAPLNLLLVLVAAIALSAFVSPPIPCMAQTADADHAAKPTQAPSQSGGTTSPSHQTDAVDDPTSQAASAPAGKFPAGAAAPARIRTVNRLAPTGESWTTIDLGTRYARAVFGGSRNIIYASITRGF